MYTKTVMGRPRIPKNLQRVRPVHIRLTHGEQQRLESAARWLGVTVSEIFREGAKLYIETRGKGGSPHRKEFKR